MEAARKTEPEVVEPILRDRPQWLPLNQENGQPVKPIAQVVLDRRATTHFRPDPIPESVLRAILEITAQSPSGYNLQPWRFILVESEDGRRKLREAAFNQPKVTEAPLVVIALGMKKEWRKYVEGIVREGAERGAGKPENSEKVAKGALEFLDKQKMDVWVTRHTMIAVTTMMLAAESYGLDTAPMEGFNPEAVRKAFDIPEEAEVVALLALGHGLGPDKPFPGRFPPEKIFHLDRYGEPFTP